jgi:putative FmdB family regulatory protein
MPLYEFLCEDCHKTFSKVLTLNEHDHSQVACPYCFSKNVTQEASTFFAVTGKKS